MKDKTAQVDELGKLLQQININENSIQFEKQETEIKCSNKLLNLIVKDEPVSDETYNEDSEGTICFDGLKSIRTAKINHKKTAADDDFDDSDDDDDDLNSEKSLEQDVLRKRGPPKPRRRNIPHSSGASSPYGNASQKDGSSSARNRTKEQQFLSGGGILPSPRDETVQENVPLNQEPLIPELSQLLDDKFLQNMYTRNNLDDNDISDETVQMFVGSEALPDLGISDMFLDMLDPNNDFSQSALAVSSEALAKSLEDPFSPLSSDIGYASASPDSRSLGSPESSFSLCVGSPSICMSPSSSSSLSSGGSHFSGSSPPSNSNLSSISISSAQAAPTKKKRNPYFEGLDENYCSKCHRAILKKAREEGGLNQKDKRNRTLLHLTIEQKDETYAVVMLNMLQKKFQNETGRGPVPNISDLQSFLNQEDDYGRTPLLLACIYNLPRVLGYLLDCGASPALKEKFFFGSVLHYVCERGSRFQDVAEILCTKASSFLNMTNSRKETPLHIAVGFHGVEHQDASTGTQEVVDNRPLIKLLLSKNAKLSAQDEFGRTPLHWMIIRRNVDFLDVFYSQGYDWKEAVNLRNMDGRTILHGAAQMIDLDVEKQRDLVQKLVVCYASPQIQDNVGKYPKDLVPEDRKAHLNVLNGHFCEDTGWQADLVM